MNVAANVSEIRLQTVMKYALNCSNHMQMHSGSLFVQRIPVSSKPTGFSSMVPQTYEGLSAAMMASHPDVAVQNDFITLNDGNLATKIQLRRTKSSPTLDTPVGRPAWKFQVWKVCCDGWHGSLESKVDRFQWFIILIRDESKDPLEAHWESKGTPPKPTPPRNKNLIRPY